MWTLKEIAELNKERLKSDIEAIRQTKAVARTYWAISLVFGAYILDFISKFTFSTSPNIIEVLLSVSFVILSMAFVGASIIFFFLVLKSEQVLALPRLHRLQAELISTNEDEDQKLKVDDPKILILEAYNQLLEERIDQNFQILKKKRLWEHRLIITLSIMAFSCIFNFSLTLI